MRDLERPGRASARSRRVMVSTSNPVATAEALAVLRSGGNAVDAAVCAMAVLGVVEALNTGIGGDCFAMIAPGGGPDILAYNGSGRAGSLADPERLRRAGYSVMPADGPCSVTIPGAVEAWARLVSDHGRLDFGRLLQPAIRHAREGYVVHDTIAMWWAGERAKLSRDEAARRIFLPGGAPPAPGDVHVQPELADTLERIAEGGPDVVYRGPVADDIVEHVAEGGGFLTSADLSGHTGEYVSPIRGRYHGLDVYECPPNGQGLAALLLLHVLEGFEIGALAPSDPRRLHLILEAGRLAMIERDRHIADPAHATIAVERLLSPEHATQLRALIDPERAADRMPAVDLPKHDDTCHVAVVDEDRTSVSLIASVFSAFGSGMVTPRHGVVLQNRGSGFVLTPGHLNELAPHKRPLHTIIPALAGRDGRVTHAFGVVGGHFQPWGHAQVLSALLDHGLDVQAALDLGRVFHDGERVRVERSLGQNVGPRLGTMGHRVRRDDEIGPTEGALGGGQIVAIDWAKGTLTGAADPRLDGCAVGY